MIKHIHTEECSSTQSVLRDNISQNYQNILISTDNQTEGIGRKGSRWIQYSNAIAMSFTIPTSKALTLIPLEMGILICQYINEKFNIQLKLKWPNDLLVQKKFKAGGIIIQNSSNKNLLVGVGLNFGKLDKQSDFGNYNAATISNDEISKEALSLDIYKYILDNRIIDYDELLNHWNNLCDHLNVEVKISEGSSLKLQGIFKGIGKSGEALIQLKDGTTKEVFSGTLSY